MMIEIASKALSNAVEKIIDAYTNLLVEAAVAVSEYEGGASSIAKLVDSAVALTLANLAALESASAVLTADRIKAEVEKVFTQIGLTSGKVAECAKNNFATKECRETLETLRNHVEKNLNIILTGIEATKIPDHIIERKRLEAEIVSTILTQYMRNPEKLDKLKHEIPRDAALKIIKIITESIPSKASIDAINDVLRNLCGGYTESEEKKTGGAHVTLSEKEL